MTAFDWQTSDRQNSAVVDIIVQFVLVYVRREQSSVVTRPRLLFADTKHNTDGMVWYGMVYVNLYSAIVANVSNAREHILPRHQGFFSVQFYAKVQF